MKRSEPNTVQPTAAPAPTAEADTPAPAASLADQLMAEEEAKAAAEVERLRAEREHIHQQRIEAENRRHAEEERRAVEAEKRRAWEAEQKRMAIEAAKKANAARILALEQDLRTYTILNGLLKKIVEKSEPMVVRPWIYSDEKSFRSAYEFTVYALNNIKEALTKADTTHS